jgi:DNA-binding MarR family transcriptional regulator/GNAT superfamily N-acetyltransferase
MTVPASQIAELRAFNRVYTRRIGLLHDRLDGSPFALAEARVLYELAHRREPIAAEIATALDIDRGQLSRILKRFERQRLISRRQSGSHAKQKLLALTAPGRRAFRDLNRATNTSVGTFLASLTAGSRAGLIEAAGTMTHVLEGEAAKATPSYVLRPPRVGDLGFVVHRQAILYAEEHGWDWTYESLAAEILAAFVRNFDAAREQAWIADIDGAIVGSIFLVATPDPAVAKLRLLYVEPSARGKGIGRALVDACIERARAIGYRTLELWTNSVLVSARRLYEAAGFRLKQEEPHHSFGKSLVGQVWTLDLDPS